MCARGCGWLGCLLTPPNACAKEIDSYNSFVYRRVIGFVGGVSTWLSDSLVAPVRPAGCTSVHRACAFILACVSVVCKQVAIGYLGYDFMFYWTHRLLHSKWLYKTVHKQHHLFRTSVGVAASYQHAVEGLIQLFNWFLPIGFAGWLNRRITGGRQGLHVSTLLVRE